MPDREKIIGELEVIKYFFRQCRENFSLGSDVENSLFDLQQAASEAITLLKEQEAVEPKKVNGYNPPMYTIYEYECEKCKSPMMNKQPFCMGCGKQVKWE